MCQNDELSNRGSEKKPSCTCTMMNHGSSCPVHGPCCSAPAVEPDQPTCAECGGTGVYKGMNSRQWPCHRCQGKTTNLAHDCNRRRCNDCVEHGGTVERARIERIIEAYHEQGAGDEYASVVQGVCVDLLAAIRGESNA